MRSIGHAAPMGCDVLEQGGRHGVDREEGCGREREVPCFKSVKLPDHVGIRNSKIGNRGIQKLSQLRDFARRGCRSRHGHGCHLSNAMQSLGRRARKGERRNAPVRHLLEAMKSIGLSAPMD